VVKVTTCGCSNLSFEVGELRPYVVKVLRANGRVIGTGFFCHPEGFVLTCRHVIDPLLNLNRGYILWRRIRCFFAGSKEEHVAAPPRSRSDSSRTDRVRLAWGKEQLEARFRADISPERSDLAVLEVLSQPPSGQKEYPFLPLDIAWRVRPGHRLESFGFPQGKQWSGEGISVGGNLVGMSRTQVKEVRAFEEVWVYTLEGFNMDNVESGFSGAPVLDRDIHKVVGLMVAKDRAHQAFLVPLTPIFQCWKDLRDVHDVRAAVRRDLRETAKAELNARL
jgi:hypothetical protein